MIPRQQLRQVQGAVWWGCIGILIVLVLALLVRTWSLADAIRETQKTNTGLQHSNARTIELIRDCTEPSGDCFQEGQKRTAHAVVGINEGTLRVIVAALTCQEAGYHGAALATCTARNASHS